MGAHDVEDCIVAAGRPWNGAVRKNVWYVFSLILFRSLIEIFAFYRSKCHISQLFTSRWSSRANWVSFKKISSTEAFSSDVRHDFFFAR